MPIVNYKNTNIHYTVQGTGKAVVLLHGFLENERMWQSILPHLVKNHSVITIDLLGHGKTENLGYIHTMEAQATMVKFVLDTLKINKSIFIGHSMGGYIALAFAELFPDKIFGLCLMNSTALPDTAEKKKNRDRGIAAVKYNAELFVKMAIPNLFSEANRVHFSKEIQEVIEEALKMSPQGIIAAMEGMKIRKDYTYVLSKGVFPILMVMSKQDPALEFQTLVNQVKNTNVMVKELPDGHMSHIENREVLIQTFVNFLK